MGDCQLTYDDGYRGNLILYFVLFGKQYVNNIEFDIVEMSFYNKKTSVHKPNMMIYEGVWPLKKKIQMKYKIFYMSNT